MARAIVLVHCAWVTNAGWDQFKARYESRGYTVIAPSWPFDDRPIAELRASPDFEVTGFLRCFELRQRRRADAQEEFSSLFAARVKILIQLKN